MKGIFGKAFLVTLLFSQLPVSAMSPAAVQTIVTPGARLLINSGRQALAQVGQRIAQNPELASGAAVLTLATTTLAGASVVKGLNKPAVMQQAAKPGMFKAVGTWVYDLSGKTKIFVKGNKKLSVAIAAGTIAVAGGVYYFINKSRKNKAAELNKDLLEAQAEALKGYKAQGTQSAELNAEAMLNQIAQMTKENEVKPTETKKAWYNPRRYFGSNSVKAEQKQEVTQAAPATEVKEEEATEAKPGMMKRAMVTTVSALSTANDYTLKPLYHNIGKVAVGVAGLGSAYYFRNGLNKNVWQPVVKLAQANPKTAKTIGGAVVAGAGSFLGYKGYKKYNGNASAQVVQGPATKLESDTASVIADLQKEVQQGSKTAQLWLNAVNLAQEGTQVFEGDAAAVKRLENTVELAKNR